MECVNVMMAMKEKTAVKLRIKKMQSQTLSITLKEFTSIKRHGCKSMEAQLKTPAHQYHSVRPYSYFTR